MITYGDILRAVAGDRATYEKITDRTYVRADDIVLDRVCILGHCRRLIFNDSVLPGLTNWTEGGFLCASRLIDQSLPEIMYGVVHDIAQTVMKANDRGNFETVEGLRDFLGTAVPLTLTPNQRRALEAIVERNREADGTAAV